MLSTEVKTKKPKIKKNEEGRQVMAGETKKENNENASAFMMSCGTDDLDLTNALVKQLTSAMPQCDINSLTFNNGLFAMLAGLAPKNELEGMLAVQMVASHTLSLEMIRRAYHPEQTDQGIKENINMCNKAMRTFALQIEALSKLRGHSKTVIVKHVTVSEGGQAVIGDVHNRGTNE